MDVIQYKCPNCGGDLKFDPASGNYACEYCKSRFSQDELDKQTNAKMGQAGGSAEPASTTDKAAATGAAGSTAAASAGSSPSDASISDAKVYTCPSCGATIVTDSTTAATFCFYCHNPVVLSDRLDKAYKPDYIVPFKIDRKKAIEIFEAWIQKKKYLPASFYSKDQIDKLTGVYFPYLMYTCSIDGSLDAQGTKVDVRIQGDIEYTDTGIYHVKRDGNMEIKHVLRNALKKADKVLSDSVLPFETEELRPFNMSYLSGFFAEKRDIDKSELAEDMKAEVMDHAVQQLKDSLDGYTDISVTTDNVKLVNEKWEYALFPTWTMTYNDSGKIYYFSINGQTGKTVGELPVDKGKLIRTFLLIFVPIAAVLLLFFYFIF